MCVVNPTPWPLYNRLGGPRSLSGRMRKISPPELFDPLTFNSVASRYTDYAILEIISACILKLN